MSTITVTRDFQHSGFPLDEVLIDKSEFCRWSNFHINSVNKMVRERTIPTTPNGGISVLWVVPYLLSQFEPGTREWKRVKAYKSWLETGTKIPDDLYVETDLERLERERAEFEANKTSETRRLERQIELNEKEARLRAALKQIVSAKSEIELLTSRIASLEASIPDFESKVNDARERFDQADQIVKAEEAKRTFQPTIDNNGLVVFEIPAKFARAVFKSESSSDVTQKNSKKK